jgi:hypothetical protein
MTTGESNPFSLADMLREAEFRREIETYVTALHSYPDRLARNPYLSFEQHLFSVVVTNQFINARGSNCER